MGQDRHIRDPLINMRQYGMFGTGWAYQLWWNESYYTTLSCGKNIRVSEMKGAEWTRDVLSVCIYVSVNVSVCVYMCVNSVTEWIRLFQNSGLFDRSLCLFCE